MSGNGDGSEPWRSIDSLLRHYGDGDIGDVDLFSALLGILDVVGVDVIYGRLSERLQAGFLEHAEWVVAEGDSLRNLVTGEPLPPEVLAGLVQWVSRMGGRR